ncbi:MAG: phenylphosphate carboxylase subunit delta [Coxiella sp. RIFCSPHIGHO2_12_FULL_44_14]|nr:MAG: phenylphosphate carboxylase subunit delta [Coxiella sp. RIFCSPHIGHO2_12_FULL_44_14]
MLITKIVKKKASRIRLLILDVDGVLTDGHLWMTEQGEYMKAFHIHDGLGIKRLQEAGITVAIISSRQSNIVTQRMQALGVKHIYQGVETKITALQALSTQLNISLESIAYVGDDEVDLPIMEQVGLSIAVANAVESVKKQADWQTIRPGGQGAVREVCDIILATSQ